MGIVARKNYLFLSVSCGYLVNKKKEIKTGAYEGTIIDIREVEDEFEGKKIAKIEVKMQDNQSDEIAVIKFTLESWYAIGFFARISKIDLTKPFIIGTLPSEQNEKMSFCYIKQEGITKVEADKEFPKPEKVEIGTKKAPKQVYSWIKPLEAIEKIMADLKSKIVVAPVVAAPAEAAPVTTGSGKEDDLPF